MLESHHIVTLSFVSKCSPEPQAGPMGGGAQELQTQAIQEVDGQVGFAASKATSLSGTKFPKALCTQDTDGFTVLNKAIVACLGFLCFDNC